MVSIAPIEVSCFLVDFHYHGFSLQDAKNLWERVQERQGLNKWRPDREEEYEDKEGKYITGRRTLIFSVRG